MVDVPCSYSLFEDVLLQADMFKWIESQKAGHDLGEDARNEWVRLHWWGYLRARWTEHLEGVRFWRELDRNDFGLLLREFPDSTPLLHLILAQVKNGKENLCIINWALNTNQPMEQVHFILERIDINARRLFCKFTNQTCMITPLPSGS